MIHEESLLMTSSAVLPGPENTTDSPKMQNVVTININYQQNAIEKKKLLLMICLFDL